MTGAGEFAHLDPNYRRFAALPDDERIAWIRADRWIGFDQAGLALARLENLLTYPARDRMPCLHGQDQDCPQVRAQSSG